MKDILLNYVMGQYRRRIAYICGFISLITIVRIITSENDQSAYDIILVILGYLAFLGSIYNYEIPGVREVNNESNNYDIGVRYIYIIITFSLFINISYLMF